MVGEDADTDRVRDAAQPHLEMLAFADGGEEFTHHLRDRVADVRRFAPQLHRSRDLSAGHRQSTGVAATVHADHPRTVRHERVRDRVGPVPGDATRWPAGGVTRMKVLRRHHAARAADGAPGSCVASADSPREV